jgi:anhydro-N-acetylmuramic acid kinase
LNNILIKENYNIIGVMSGTSLDGIDVVYIHFEKKEKWTYKVINSITYKYSKEWFNKLKTSVNLSRIDLTKLDQEYTLLLLKQILRFINEFSIKDIDAVSSHGHTVFHDPKNKFTYQIGNLPQISKKIGHKVICNFRQQDVSLGGQGAPLVPVGEKYLFSEYDSCINLGGFANISKTLDGKLIAYDICPVNTVLNYLSNKMNLDFDKDGEISKNGRLIEDLYTKLNKLDYYNISHPKSLGIEWLNSNITPLLDQYPSQIIDLLHTYTHHIAEQVSKNTINETNILVTGGGAKNKFLIGLINKKLKNNIVIPDNILIDYKEAIIFGFLGLLKLLNINNCYSSVTGSSIDHCSGDIFLP